MNIPDDRKYSPSHEWSKLEADVITVGISDYAQDQLGDVVFVELPEAGSSIGRGEQVAVVESVKTASDIYAPAQGEIVEVNDALSNRPELLNEDPYGDGWLFRIRVSDTGSISELLDASAYQKVIEEDS